MISTKSGRWTSASMTNACLPSAIKTRTTAATKRLLTSTGHIPRRRWRYSDANSPKRLIKMNFRFRPRMSLIIRAKISRHSWVSHQTSQSEREKSRTKFEQAKPLTKSRDSIRCLLWTIRSWDLMNIYKSVRHQVRIEAERPAGKRAQSGWKGAWWRGQAVPSANGRLPSAICQTMEIKAMCYNEIKTETESSK